MKLDFPFRPGQTVRVRHIRNAKAHGLTLNKEYVITKTINSKSRRGQYIELEGMGDKRFYALYFELIE